MDFSVFQLFKWMRASKKGVGRKRPQIQCFFIFYFLQIAPLENLRNVDVFMECIKFEIIAMFDRFKKF